MAKVIRTCAKICCGKSTYARRLQAEGNAVILSIDEITLSLFPERAANRGAFGLLCGRRTPPESGIPV